MSKTYIVLISIESAETEEGSPFCNLKTEQEPKQVECFETIEQAQAFVNRLMEPVNEN